MQGFLALVYTKRQKRKVAFFYIYARIIMKTTQKGFTLIELLVV
ncbi:MAG: prepilin-type N-terminal cleavage/methylation domain-containing protein, partial [Candidatus Wildermuthbacteria bacterium]|nr:prepilin-type N-terminal cleavage/methylation domain-containing protein [Candidatus Wildermuthbacteria bacterium]